MLRSGLRRSHEPSIHNWIVCGLRWASENFAISLVIMFCFTEKSFKIFLCVWFFFNLYFLIREIPFLLSLTVPYLLHFISFRTSLRVAFKALFSCFPPSFKFYHWWTGGKSMPAWIKPGWWIRFHQGSCDSISTRMFEEYKPSFYSD